MYSLLIFKIFLLLFWIVIDYVAMCMLITLLCKSIYTNGFTSSLHFRIENFLKVFQDGCTLKMFFFRI